MSLIAGLLVGVWFAYTYYKYGETKEVFYPVSGFLVAYFYSALMTAAPTAEFVVGIL